MNIDETASTLEFWYSNGMKKNDFLAPEDYVGGPLVIAPSDGHWIDFWTQECSRCGELADQIAALGLECRAPNGVPDYLATTREVVGIG